MPNERAVHTQLHDIYDNYPSLPLGTLELPVIASHIAAAANYLEHFKREPDLYGPTVMSAVVPDLVICARQILLCTGFDRQFIKAFLQRQLPPASFDAAVKDAQEAADTLAYYENGNGSKPLLGDVITATVPALYSTAEWLAMLFKANLSNAVAARVSELPN